MPVLSEKARAKVNLTLRVVGRRADGYHDLESVVAFADCADRLTLTPGSDLDLKMPGRWRRRAAIRRTIWCSRRRGCWASAYRT